MREFERLVECMGTVFVFRGRTSVSDAVLEEALLSAENSLHKADSIFSLYKPQSPLSQLARGETSVAKCPPVVDEVWNLCEEWEKRTGGWFKAFTPQNTFDPSGLVKTWAAEFAARALLAAGIEDFTMNAGGDIRVLGTKGFRVDICHAQEQLRDRPFKRLKRLQSAALATSVADTHQTAFVRTLKARREAWRNSTVLAPDCMTADALTKWALQSSRLCPQLKAAMRLHSASMWRS